MSDTPITRQLDALEAIYNEPSGIVESWVIGGGRVRPPRTKAGVIHARVWKALRARGELDVYRPWGGSLNVRIFDVTLKGVQRLEDAGRI